MFYIPELLHRRNQGRMSRCWLAATLSETEFKKKCKPKELINFNIELASEDIMNGINEKRFSLYLSSQLVFGIIKIYLYKTGSLDVFAKNVLNDLRPINLKILQKKEKKLETILNLELPEPIDVTETFMKQLEKPDLHLLSENALYNASFSGIQDDEFEERQFDVLTTNDLSAHLKDFFSNEAGRTDESQEYVRESSTVTRQPLSDLHTSNLPNGNDPRTPSKRKGRSIDNNTPSKRHRRGLLFPLGDKENVPPTKIPSIDEPNNFQGNMGDDPSIPFPDVSSVRPSGPIHSLSEDAHHPDVPAEQPLETLSSIIDDVLSLEPLVSPEIPLRRRRKPEKLIIDEINTIPRSEMQSRTNNIKIMTRLRDIVNIDRIRFDSELLFTKPSTSRRGRSIIDCSNALKSLFKLNIKHQFHIDYDKSLFPENIRYPETSENTVELSSGDSRQKQQTNGLSVKDISDPIANVDKIIPHGEIENEILIDIEDTRTIMEPTIHSELTNVGDQTNVIQTDDTLRVRDSTKSITNSSSFLPENYDKSLVHKQSSASTEKIIDISSRSLSNSPIFYERSIENMYNDLKRRWREKDDPINFENLFVPAEIKEFIISCTLLYLLHLANNSQIDLKQSEPYEIIWIYSS